jgi:hypothetical protein
MRIRFASILVVALVTGGLALNGVEALAPARDRCVKRLLLEIQPCVSSLRALMLDAVTSEVGKHQPGSTYALVVTDGIIAGCDRDGYVTCVDKVFAGRSLPALTGFSVEGVHPGRRIGLPEVTRGLSVIMAFEPHAGLFKMLSEVNVSELQHPRVILRGGVVVELGRGDYSTKVERLRQVLVQAPHLGMYPTRVDLRFTRRAIVQYREVRHRGRKEV